MNDAKKITRASPNRSPSLPAKIAAITYPVAKKVDTVTNYFGTAVPDPYRWMEEIERPDVAEWVKSSGDLLPAAVVIIDPQGPNRVTISNKAYDTRVAGVVSLKPGLLLGEAGEDKAKVAHSGRVKVKVDASYGPITAGDLLVTSSIPGHAMRSEPMDVGGAKLHRPGTLIGKALESLEKGQGEVLVLLTLQ